MERRGIASIAILPSGSISGHFVDTSTSECLGLFGTQIACERECSRGEDYKLINLSILDFTSKREVQAIVESHGQDAARFQNATNIHGWEEDVLEAVQRKDRGIGVPTVNFECEILKADEDAECHVQRYLPSLAGRGAIVNVGTMDIKGLKFESTQEAEQIQQQHTECAVSADSHGADESHDECGLLDSLREEVSCNASTSISTGGKGLCAICKPSRKRFAEFLREELEVEGLSKQGIKEETLTGWRQKQVVSNESEDSF
ncbi:hypothetical protein GOP47_0029859 [Adiantum capillus-veneris]|nr:hypothetical protein GOP47_0029859 [Adiantum capillus-veneris]